MSRAKGLSNVQRTLRELRDQGRVCAVVERRNQFVGPHGISEDLFGIIDVLALDPARGVVGVQVCGQDFAGHVRKITEEKRQETYEWLRTPGTVLEIWGWRKVKAKRGGKLMLWKPRVQEITMEDLEA
jgi:hypothetical protein